MTDKLELHKYQQRAIDFTLRRRISYQMVDLGLGKTIIALKAIQMTKLSAIIFAPIRGCYITWPDEIKKWGLDMSYTILHGADKNIRVGLERRVYLINYEGLKWFYNKCVQRKFRLRKMFMVWDESSMVKDPSTQRFKLFKALQNLFSMYRINLSATPSPLGLHNLWSQYYLLDGGERLGKSYYRFMTEHFFETGPPLYKTILRDNHESLIHDKIKDITFRLQADDYLELPDVVFNDINITLPPILMGKYNKLEQDFALTFGSELVTAQFAGSLSNKLRQFCQGALYLDTYTGDVRNYVKLHTLKCAALEEVIEIAQSPVLCAIQFRFELDLVRKYFKKEVPIIYGKTPLKQALQWVREWNDGTLPLLLCHPKSISHSLNLQFSGHTIFWMGLPWSLEQYRQLIGRIARQGQKSNVVVVHNALLQNTIDPIVAKVLSNRQATEDSLKQAIYEHCKKWL